MSSKALDYNKKTSKEYGWTPDWFGASDYDDNLLSKIKEFQKEHDIDSDGMCGPGTYRRIYADRVSSMAYSKKELKNTDRNLIYMGNEIPIEWDKVTRWVDPDGLECKHFSNYDKKRKITTFVNHWDVCLNSEACVNVLNKRGVSVQLCIDNDGTVHQLMDLNDAAWHASSRSYNHASIGVEIANVYYPKYQSWYIKNGFGERPIISGETIHGNPMKDFMGFYPVQLEALKAVWKCLHKEIGIPYECPLDSSGNTSKTVYKGPVFEGFISHYHVTEKKIDCAGLDINKMLQEIKNE